jgi:hypothetical protein
MKFLAVLDTMWGSGGAAPRWFHINPWNVSGKRLYALTGATFRELKVTNACPQQTTHATKHGTPSAWWLAENLTRYLPSGYAGAPLLICGTVAQKTFAKLARHQHNGPVILMPHPAARNWSRANVERWQRTLLKEISNA